MGRINKVLLIATIASTAMYMLAVFIGHQFSKEPATPAASDYAIVTFDPQTLVITAQVANSIEARQAAMAFRKPLAGNAGVLSVFSAPYDAAISMINITVPIDMVFISENSDIVKIVHAVPCFQEPCASYSAGEPVKYVLELRGNLTGENGIEAGGTVEIIR